MFGGDRQVGVRRTGRESLVAIGDVNQQFHQEPLVFVNAKMVVGRDFPHVTTKDLHVMTYAFMANNFLEGSTWYWNDWRDVEFREDHTFYAPDGNCDNEECTWRTEGGNIIIDWGRAGVHKVRPSNDRKRLTGERVRDGDPCHAELRKEGRKQKEQMRKEIKKNADGSVNPEDWITDVEDEEYDPYIILGVDPDDDEGKIKKAFRKLSRKYHPDKIRGNEEKKKAQKDF